MCYHIIYGKERGLWEPCGISHEAELENGP